MKSKTIIHLLSVMVIGALIISCSHDPEEPGYTFFPDMINSQAYETYSENPLYEDGKTMREPVEGTIPRGYTPFPYEKTQEDRLKAGKELTNPFDATPETVKKGKKLYGYYCIQCHGKQGDGQGHLYTSGLYAYQPASLINEKMKTVPDGDIYHVITVGFGIMGEHGSIVRPDDRWKIIHYIREELQEEGS